MGALTDQARTVYRDFATDGVPASGPNEPAKSDIRGLHQSIDLALSSVILGAIMSSAVVYPTLSALNGDLAHAANTLGVVYNDSTDANNGIYAKAGASGSGSWTLTDLALPASFSGDLSSVIAALAGKLDKAGGDLGSNTAPSLILNFNAAAGAIRVQKYKTAGVDRWVYGVISSGSGGIATTDVFWNRYSDSGAYLNTPLTLRGSDGAMVSPTKQKFGNVGWVDGTYSGLESLIAQVIGVSPNGGAGGIFISRGSDAGTGNPNSDSTWGLGAFAIADNHSSVQFVHSLYAEAWRVADGSYVPGAEFAGVNTGSVVRNDPINAIPLGVTSAIWSSWGRTDRSGSTDGSSIWTLAPATGTAGYPITGIVIAKGAVHPSYNRAMAIYKPYSFTWVDDNGLDTLSISGNGCGYIARSDTSAFVSDSFRYGHYDAGLGRGVDTTAGMELWRQNGWGIASGSPILRASLAARFESLARGSIFFEALNEASQTVRVGLNMENNVLGANVDNVISLFSSANRAATIWVATGAFNTSDIATKAASESNQAPTDWRDFEAVPTAVASAVLKTRIVRYKVRDALAGKAWDAARWHYGIIAQELHDNLVEAGEDPFASGMLGRDPLMTTVTRMRTVERDVMEDHPVEMTRYEVRDDGKAYAVPYTDTKQRPKTEEIQVHDLETGKPIILPAQPAKVDPDTGDELVPAQPERRQTMTVNVTEPFEESYEAEEQAQDVDGNLLWRMSVRYDEFWAARFAAMQVA